MPDRSWTRPAMATLLPTAMAAGTLFYAMFPVLATFVIDDLGGGGRLAGELGSHPQARLGNRTAEDDAVRPREVDLLEGAKTRS